MREIFTGGGGCTGDRGRWCFVGGHGVGRESNDGILGVGRRGRRRDGAGRRSLTPWQGVVCVPRSTVVGRVASMTTVTVALPPERQGNMIRRWVI